LASFGARRTNYIARLWKLRGDRAPGLSRGSAETIASNTDDGLTGPPYTRPTYSRRGPTMAVGIRLKFNGGTQENYDAAHAVMDIGTDPPEGMIVHSAGPVDGGWGVIDFW